MKPMKKLAKTLKGRTDDILTYCTHGITNGVTEGINSKIISIERRVGGYRNIENVKATFFCCSGLDPYQRNPRWTESCPAAKGRRRLRQFLISCKW
jgi:transposase